MLFSFIKKTKESDMAKKLIKKSKAIRKLLDAELLIAEICPDSNPEYLNKLKDKYIEKWYDGDITKKLEHYKSVRYE